MIRFTLNDFFGNQSRFDYFKRSVANRIQKKRIIYMSSEQIIIDDSPVSSVPELIYMGSEQIIIDVSAVPEIIDAIKHEALEEPDHV